ncbi:MAG: alpha/beta hydrolase-fold protein [Planctomycetes bacterium]|jgi:dienelactone hydrolase|nr:alpha/beta hydrolase-fold protein [Planctomycetota bacterium]
MRSAPLLSLSCVAVGHAIAQAPVPEAAPVPTGFLDQTITIDGREHRYVVYVPPGYTKERDWPLLVFLNGKGECGTDGKRHVEVGLGPAIAREPERWPFVVAFPQKPQSETWWPDHEDLALAIADQVERDYRIDPRQRFLTGLSQGGHGTWVLGSKHAERWAALAPVCGFKLGALPLEPLRDKPVWAFHGLADNVVPAQQSKELCAALTKLGGAPVLTLYEGVGHNSWDRAYRESALPEWLRTVVRQPVLARYLAEPAALEAATITITWNEPAATGGAAKPAMVRITGAGNQITVDAKIGTGVGQARTSDGPHWRDDRDDAVELVYEPLQALARAGVFELVPSDAAPAAGAGHRVAIELDGKAGGWTFATEVPADPASKQVERAAIERILAMAKSKAFPTK